MLIQLCHLSIVPSGTDTEGGSVGGIPKGEVIDLFVSGVEMLFL